MPLGVPQYREARGGERGWQGGREGGERGWGWATGQEDARRTTQWVTSDVTANHNRNVDVRAAEKATATAPKRANRKPGAMCATHNCHANADWMSPSATHATQKCMGARGMDWRGARGGETEAMDRRGQDHATLKWCEMAKRVTKERQMSPGAISAKDVVPPVPRLPRNSSVDVSSPPAAERWMGARERDYSD